MNWIENFQLKQRAYYNDGRSQGKKVRKLTLKSPKKIVNMVADSLVHGIGLPNGDGETKSKTPFKATLLHESLEPSTFKQYKSKIFIFQT